MKYLLILSSLVSLVLVGCKKKSTDHNLRNDGAGFDQGRYQLVTYLFTHQNHEQKYAFAEWIIGDRYASDETAEILDVHPKAGSDDSWVLIRYFGRDSDQKDDLSRVEFASSLIAKRSGMPTTPMMMASLTIGTTTSHFRVVKKKHVEAMPLFTFESLDLIQSSEWTKFSQLYATKVAELYGTNKIFLVGAETADAVIWDAEAMSWKLHEPTVLTNGESLRAHAQGLLSQHPRVARIQKFAQGIDDLFSQGFALQSNPQSGVDNDRLRQVMTQGVQINPGANHLLARNPLLTRGHAFYRNETAEGAFNPITHNQGIRRINRIPRVMVEEAGPCNPQSGDF